MCVQFNPIRLHNTSCLPHLCVLKPHKVWPAVRPAANLLCRVLLSPSIRKYNTRVFANYHFMSLVVGGSCGWPEHGQGTVLIHSREISTPDHVLVLLVESIGTCICCHHGSRRFGVFIPCFTLCVVYHRAASRACGSMGVICVPARVADTPSVNCLFQCGDRMWGWGWTYNARTVSPHLLGGLTWQAKRKLAATTRSSHWGRPYRCPVLINYIRMVGLQLSVGMHMTNACPWATEQMTQSSPAFRCRLDRTHTHNPLVVRAPSARSKHPYMSQQSNERRVPNQALAAPAKTGG